MATNRVYNTSKLHAITVEQTTIVGKITTLTSTKLQGIDIHIVGYMNENNEIFVSYSWIYE